ncbi:MAG: ParA family protein [Clostridiaceae bacterium]|nr:ParA family protein [Clostridiaceae bacterium]
MTKIIAVANQKGGVAKTTTTGAFAAGLKKRGFRVLAIDLDPQGNLSDSVGAEMYESPTVFDLLKREASPKEAIQELNVFDIIPANIMLASAEQEFSQTGKEHRLKETLLPVVENYDYIIIDTPPALGVLTVNAFTFADEIIIPTTAGIFAANGIQQLNTTVKNVKKYCNPKVKIAGILLTRFNPRSIINKDLKELTEQLGTHIEAQMYKAFIRNSVVVEEAQANKVDLFTYKNDATVTEDYNKFIDEYLKGDNENG